jgi:hypothetical protein
MYFQGIVISSHMGFVYEHAEELTAFKWCRDLSDMSDNHKDWDVFGSNRAGGSFHDAV